MGILSFLKNKPSATADSLRMLGTDMHSHLLPGIDDGSPDIETSVKLINGLQELGITKIITTPHVLWDLYQNERETILAKEKEVNDALAARGMEIRVKAAAEYFMDDHFTLMLDNKEPLLTVDNHSVLVEFSFVSAPLNLQQILFKLELAGYRPIMAHPERYSYFHTDKSHYHDFFDRGYLLQVNLLSLTGYYGKGPLEAARYLLKNRMVSLFGTDMHHIRHLQGLQHKELFRIVAESTEKGDIINRDL